MSPRFRVLGLAGFLSLRAVAAPAPLETLEDASGKEKAALAAITTQRDQKVTILDKWYADSLEVVQKHATEKGDLDLVVATRTEAGRVGVPLSPEEIQRLPAPLPTLRGQYDQARATIATWERTMSQTATKALVADLETLEKQFTRAAKIDEAVQARAERTKVTARLLGNSPAPATGEAAVGPAPSAPPAEPPAAPKSAPSGPGHAETVTIAANSPDAYPLHDLRKGSRISLQYAGGKWKTWGHVAGISPDDEKIDATESCRTVIALPAKDGKGGEVLSIVPAGTAKSPFIYEVTSDYPELVLRINDREGSFSGNPGKVEYQVEVVPPIK